MTKDLSIEFNIDDFKYLYPHSFERLCEFLKSFGSVIFIKLCFAYRRPQGFMLYFSHNTEYFERQYYVSIFDLCNYEDRFGGNDND